MSTKSNTQHYVLCISNEKYPVSLEARKIYQCIPDTQAEAHGQIRVIDESGEDYLYPVRPGSNVHDEIYYESKKHKFYRKTNRAGGIEGGMTNGELVVVRAAMKPIPTHKIPLQSVDMISKDVVKAAVERSDVCAVPAAAVVGEAAVAFEMAKAIKEKFGGDSLTEMKRNYDSYLEYVSKL